jgi:hypothetical protein
MEVVVAMLLSSITDPMGISTGIREWGLVAAQVSDQLFLIHY